MAAGRRDLERALGVGVAADVGEVEVVRAVFRGPGPAVGLLRRDVALTVQVLDGVVNGLDGNDGETAHHRGLDGVGGRDEEPRDTGAPAMKGHGQHAPSRADMAVQRELAEDDRLFEAPRLQQSRGREDTERHGQIEHRAFLAKLGGGEIDRDAVHGKLEPRVAYGGAHAVAALSHGGVR